MPGAPARNGSHKMTFMPRFRIRANLDPPVALEPGSLFDDLFQPCHFYVGPHLAVTWHSAADETIPWEIYQGRLLDARQTRASNTFRSWSLLEATAQAETPRPILSLKWDSPRGEVHVVRGMLCHVWESCDTGGNVIDSRETTKWVLELVGTLALDEFTDGDELRDELICRLWQAVVGTSRLPLTSLEAPLPAFVFGQLAYVYQPGGARGEALRHWRELLEQGWLPELAWHEQAKLLECVLRAVAAHEVPAAAACLTGRWKALGQQPGDIIRLMKTVFNDVSLSPWSAFAGNAMALVQALVDQRAWRMLDEIEFLSWLVVKLSGHLTAYDLVTFHHRGANYPDALLLDAILMRLLACAERAPHHFEDDGAGTLGAAARGALLRGALLRRTYEGHAVPDAPTSPGENARVLPAPWARVPDEQLINPRRRQRRLFADNPLAGLWTATTRDVFQRSLLDLSQFPKVEALGTAVFIDRPFGFGKAPLEPDQTPLLAHLAHSPAIALRRMVALAAMAKEMNLTLPENWESSCRALSENRSAVGMPIQRCATLGRPVATLADAQRVSDDFILLRTLPESVRSLRELFYWDDLQRRFLLDELWQSPHLQWLRVPAGHQGTVMMVCLATVSRMVLETDPSRGFRCRGGVELPAAGLRIWQVTDDNGKVHDLRSDVVYVLPR